MLVDGGARARGPPGPESRGRCYLYGMVRDRVVSHPRVQRARERVVTAGTTGRRGRVRVFMTAYGREILDDDLLGLAAELSYRWLFALFPLVIMLVAISTLLADSLSLGTDLTDDIINAVTTAFPSDAGEAISPQLVDVVNARSGALLSLGLLLTVYAASSGMRALIKGLNRAYDLTEVRPVWRQFMVALALTIMLATTVVVFFVLLLGGQDVAHDLAVSLGVREAVVTGFELARFPIAVVALTVASAFLYWAAPARKTSWKRVLPGVALFVPAWILTTVGFSFYIENFSSYDDTYGSISGIIVLLLWLYLAALILLLGGELNATLEQFRNGTIGPDGKRRTTKAHAVGHPDAVVAKQGNARGPDGQGPWRT